VILRVRMHRCGLRRSRSHGRAAEWPWWVRHGRSVTRHSLRPCNRGPGERHGVETVVEQCRDPHKSTGDSNFRSGEPPSLWCLLSNLLQQRHWQRTVKSRLALSIVRWVIALCCNKLWAARVIALSRGGPAHGTSWSEVQCVWSQHPLTGSHHSSCNTHLLSTGLHRPAMRSLRPPSRGGCCTRGASSRCAATRPASY
jgi:hypothetical protein